MLGGECILECERAVSSGTTKHVILLKNIEVALLVIHQHSNVKQVVVEFVFRSEPLSSPSPQPLLKSFPVVVGCSWIEVVFQYSLPETRGCYG